MSETVEVIFRLVSTANHWNYIILIVGIGFTGGGNSLLVQSGSGKVADF